MGLGPLSPITPPQFTSLSLVYALTKVKWSCHETKIEVRGKNEIGVKCRGGFQNDRVVTFCITFIPIFWLSFRFFNLPYIDNFHLLNWCICRCMLHITKTITKPILVICIFHLISFSVTTHLVKYVYLCYISFCLWCLFIAHHFFW